MFSQVETGHFGGFYTLLQYLAYFPVVVVLLHMNYTLCINVNRIKRQKPKVWVKRGVGGGGVVKCPTSPCSPACACHPG